MKLAGKLAALMGAMLMTAWSSAADNLTGRWLDGKAVSGQDEREYKLYVPSSYRSAPMSLVVMLHGCMQSPDAFADSTRMNSLAEREGFLVLYPAQKLTANPARCWNWFVPANQSRGAGEPALIVAMIDAVGKAYAVNRRHVYVAGLSGGGSMSAILAACYPDVFAAAAVEGGTMYKAAGTLIDAEKVMASGKAPDPERLAADAWTCGGQRRLAIPIAIWQGEDDKVVDRANGQALVRQFLRLNDLSDDGLANASRPQTPVRSSKQVSGGHAFTVDSYPYQGRPLIEYYQVAGMGHAWSGGRDDMAFSDGKGPDSTALIWEFFARYSR